VAQATQSDSRRVVQETLGIGKQGTISTYAITYFIDSAGPVIFSVFAPAWRNRWQHLWFITEEAHHVQ